MVAQREKNLPAMQETWVQPHGREDPLEKGMATHSSILNWKIPGRLPSMASLVAQMVKRLPAMQETWVQLLGQEDPLEKRIRANKFVNHNNQQ